MVLGFSVARSNVGVRLSDLRSAGLTCRLTVELYVFFIEVIEFSNHLLGDSIGVRDQF